jgi:ElaB/YqjD/DUF883 family membrane-anchored ribosome-binding protein
MRKEYHKRSDEVSGSMDGLRKEFGRRADDVRGAAENLREEYEKRADIVHAKLDQSIDDSRHTVQRHPLTAVGVTLGVGIVAGVLLGRKSKA